MQFVVILGLVAFVGLTVASPLPQQGAQIVRNEQEIGINGYSYNFEQTDGTSASQSGVITNPEEPDPEKRNLAVRGQFQYVGDDGKTYSVTYTADENGYQPKSTR